jgi:hypothetical protein
MPADLIEQNFRNAAVKCLRIAQRSEDDSTRTKLIVIAQKWLELSNGRFGASRVNDDVFDAAVGTHNDKQVQG